PQLATVIAVLVTDAAIEPAALRAAIASAVSDTFNALTIDGDTSTNDAVIALANGLAGAVSTDAFTAAARDVFRELARAIAVDGRAGSAEATAWGCDLSYDYVKINADYTSLIVETADGGVRKDDRLTNYSPKFKVTLLVEALSYIDRFRGQRCVVTYGA